VNFPLWGQTKRGSCRPKIISMPVTRAVTLTSDLAGTLALFD